MSLFTKRKLRVMPIDGTEDFELLTPLVWQLVYGKPWLGLVFIPEGFITDWDSTPKILRPFLPGRLRARRSFTLHDWEFNRGFIWKQHPDCTRATPVMVSFSQWNTLMREAMKAEGVGRFTRWSMYAGVSTFGRIIWNQKQQRRQAIFKLEKLNSTIQPKQWRDFLNETYE